MKRYFKAECIIIFSAVLILAVSCGDSGLWRERHIEAFTAVLNEAESYRNYTEKNLDYMIEISSKLDEKNSEIYYEAWQRVYAETGGCFKTLRSAELVSLFTVLREKVLEAADMGVDSLKGCLAWAIEQK